jgi:arabinose-5-phosphate isomerase
VARRTSSKAEAEALRARAREVFEQGARALLLSAKVIDESFVAAARRIARLRGRVVVTGIGKAGFIAQKVSATLASTGTPSLYLHPTDALHGDLGRITADDLLLAFSHSGETEELVRLLGPVKRLGAFVLAVTGERDSSLGREADLVLEMGHYEEAGHGLAPTTSTTVMLGFGDALAIAVLHLRGFSEEDFHQNHPAGALGRRLMRVEDVMRRGERVPLVKPTATLREVISVMSKTPGRPGAALVVGPKARLSGIFTDGDLRRLLEENQQLDLSIRVRDVMGRSPKTVRAQERLSEAVRLLREYRIDQVAVVDDAGAPVGLLDVQDLLARRAV